MVKVPRSNKATPARGSAPALDDGLLQFVEDLRSRLARIEAYARAADELLSQTPWGVARHYRRDFSRLGYYLADAAETVTATIDEYDAQMRGSCDVAPSTADARLESVSFEHSRTAWQRRTSIGFRVLSQANPLDRSDVPR